MGLIKCLECRTEVFEKQRVVLNVEIVEIYLLSVE